MDFKGKKVLVCGMARSGISAAFLLNSLGSEVTIQDKKNREELKNLQQFEEKGIRILAGENPDKIALEQDLIILSPGVPKDLSFIIEAENKNIPVWSEIELAYRLAKCKIAAITGTNGKTTTTTLAGEMLKSYFSNSCVVGNIGIPFTQKVEELNSNDWVAAEISSFQLEKIYEFHPQISAVLNITPDHLDRHKTMENYIKTKERIFENQNSDDFLILNYDDIVCREMCERSPAKILYFSTENILENGIYLKDDNIIIKWENSDEKIININDMQILGEHNYQNAMASIGIALCAGVPMENIRKVLKEFKGVEHRIEYVKTVSGIDFYNDSKGTNPDAAIKGVLAMKKPIVLIGGGRNKGSAFDSWVETFEGKVKTLVLIGESADLIEETAKKHGFFNVIKTDTFENAINISYENAEKGDCVLLSPACASWDMFDSYEQRGDIFKQKVNELNEK